MAKSSRRRAVVAVQQSNREAWKSMTPEARKEWNEHHVRTAKTGYAKRQRERGNGAPMASRTGAGVRRGFMTPRAVPCPEFAPWLREFQRMTA
jgi:hypothetical protein